MSQSTLAHRLSQKAFKTGGQEKQISVILAVFKAYLQDAKDIADIDLLSDLAEQNNVMTKNEVRHLIIVFSKYLMEKFFSLSWLLHSVIANRP